MAMFGADDRLIASGGESRAWCITASDQWCRYFD